MSAVGPLTASVVLAKAQLLETIADRAEVLAKDDESGFTDMIRALIEAGFTASRIAKHTSVCNSAVTRWSQGMTSPYPTGRPIMARHLAKHARLFAEDRRASVAVAGPEIAQAA